MTDLDTVAFDAIVSTDITHHREKINGIMMHWVEAGEPDAPAVMLCHGFPHVWFTWHRQITAIVDAGWRVIVPDMRGFGYSDTPATVEDFSPEHIVGDLTGILDHCGIDKAVFIGFDFGAGAVYDVCHLSPERATAVVGLQNPFMGTQGEVPPITAFKAMGEKHFLHVVYFQDSPRAENDLDANTEEFLKKVYFTLSADNEDFFSMWAHPPTATYLEAMNDAPDLPWSWLSQEEFDALVAEFDRTGFAGPLAWYRAMDVSWQSRKNFDRATNPVPFYFVYSEHDPDMQGFHGRDPLGRLEKYHDDIRGVYTVSKAGHLMHLEMTDELNNQLVTILGDVRSAQ